MTNAKKIYSTLLDNAALKVLVDEDSIFDSYPDNVESFPCVIYLDKNQYEIEYADNKSYADRLEVQLHIFTKSVDGYPTTSEIGVIINNIFKSDYWACVQNGEYEDVVDNIKHRVMTFRKEILF